MDDPSDLLICAHALYGMTFLSGPASRTELCRDVDVLSTSHLLSVIVPKRPQLDLLMPQEAARRLHIDVRTLARWAKEGRIAFVLLPSGHRRYRVEDVEAIRRPKQASA